MIFFGNFTSKILKRHFQAHGLLEEPFSSPKPVPDRMVVIYAEAVNIRGWMGAIGIRNIATESHSLR